MSLKILILDDEPKMGRILSRVLSREGHQVESSVDPREALQTMAKDHFDLLLTDLKMPVMSGLEVMVKVREEIDPEIDVIMMTAYQTVESAVQAMKQGAREYLIKPFHNEELIMRVAQIAEERGLREENKMLKETLAASVKPRDVIAQSQAMQAVIKRAQKVAVSNASVLLRGESGTGKEVLASLIHATSLRRDKPFIIVNCGALTETLLESELFGHTRGAFTGATETRKGIFQAADGGTIFLDEIGEISPALQVKLLRVLQSGEFQRVGDPQSLKADIRVIAATNRSLEDLIREGTFRSDLYYRLNVVPIEIPPLRNRPEDIPPLIDHFLVRYKPEGTKAKRLSKEAYDRLIQASWPGNIRELENAIEHAIVLSEGDRIEVGDLPVSIQDLSSGVLDAAASNGADLKDMTLGEIEKRQIMEALEEAGFNHTKAAQKLGVTRRTLGYRIDKYGLPRRAKDANNQSDT